MKITRTSLRQIILTELGTSLTAPKKNIKESSRDGHWHDAGYEDGSDGLDPKYLDNMDYMAGHEMGEEDAEYDVERGNKPSAVQVGINDDPETLDADDLRAMAKKLEKSKEYIPSHLRLKKDPMERAYARKEIVKDYMAWTKLTGQITPAASSVLATYLVDQGLDQDKEQISTLASDLQLDTADVEHELATAKAEYDAGGVESEEDNYERGFYRESKMKITRTRLSQLIKEEVNRVLLEADADPQAIKDDLKKTNKELIDPDPNAVTFSHGGGKTYISVTLKKGAMAHKFNIGTHPLRLKKQVTLSGGNHQGQIRIQYEITK